MRQNLHASFRCLIAWSMSRGIPGFRSMMDEDRAQLVPLVQEGFLTLDGSLNR